MFVLASSTMGTPIASQARGRLYQPIRDAATIMIIASVNGTQGQGFLETIERDDGSVQRAGMFKLSAHAARQLQQCLERQQPLIYSGPVLANGRWCADTFPIIATSVVSEPGSPLVSFTLCDRVSEVAAA